MHNQYVEVKLRGASQSRFAVIQIKRKIAQSRAISFTPTTKAKIERVPTISVDKYRAYT